VANGEWGCTVIFFQQVGKTVEENGEAKRISFPLMRYYTVFAADQVTGAEEFMEGPAEPAFVPHDECEKLLTCSGAEIVHGGEAACYSPGNDRIMLPPRRTFKSPDAYYATALHELAHWTGHESRLNRLAKLGRFGSDSYAMEELVAEMASCYMMGYAGIPIVEGDALAHHASYVANWLQVLKKDEYAVFTAATAASAASDYVLKLAGVVEEEVEEAAVAA
jgi:antirestriction protein ArdC